MTTHDPIPGYKDGSFEAMREDIIEVIDNNPKYLHYAQGKGVLPANEIITDMSDAAWDFVSSHEWPDATDSDIRTNSVTFDSDEEFLDALRNYDNPNYLNNFNVLLRTLVAVDARGTNIDAGAFAEKIYATKPVLFRMYALAPELIALIQAFYIEAAKQYERSDDLTSFLKQPENEPIIEATHLTYKIMKRLFKKDDQYRQMRALFGSDTAGAELIFDAHDELAL
jgi:hypothetical protein